MMVGVDQAGHHQAAPGVDCAIRRVLVGREVAHVDDVIAFDENAAVLDKVVAFVERDQVSVGDQQ